MPTLSIDDREVSVPDDTTVIQAAEKLGIFIPRYCYHPGLSIAGNCRICLGEIQRVLDLIPRDKLVGTVLNKSRGNNPFPYSPYYGPE